MVCKVIENAEESISNSKDETRLKRMDLMEIVSKMNGNKLKTEIVARIPTRYFTGTDTMSSVFAALPSHHVVFLVM